MIKNEGTAGVTDLFSSAYEKTKSAVVGAYDSSVNWTKEQFTSMNNKYEEAKKKYAELISLQKQVDAKISSLPLGPERTRLEKERDESRGFFTKYVIPAWQKLSSYFGSDSERKTLGAVPLVVAGGALAVGAALTAFLSYLATSTYKEAKILNDPSLSASQKTALITGGGITGGLVQANKLVMLLGAVGLGYVAFRLAKKHNKI